MINDLHSNVNLSLFADDCAFWKATKNPKVLNTILQKTLNDLLTWANLWGFKISKEKTVCIVFSKKKRIDLELYVQGSRIKQENKAKFLGLVFDSRLTWSSHFEYLIGRCSKRLNILRCLTGTVWGSDKDTVILCYKALIRSILEYGAVAFDSASSSQKARLDKIQNQALRVACGALRSTPIEALQVECACPPLQLRRTGALLLYFLKASAHDIPSKHCFEHTWYTDSTKCEVVSKKLFQYEFMENLVINKGTISPIPPWHFPEAIVDLFLQNNVKKKSPSAQDIVLVTEFVNNWVSHLQIFTDASKAEEKVGGAFYIPSFSIEKSFRYSDHISVYRGEQLAILKALLWVMEVQPLRVIIFSDSLSALTALDQVDSNLSSLDMEILVNLREILSLGIDIRFAWVPSHIGLSGNEKVDKLAKAALKEDITVQVDLSLSEARSIIKFHLKDMWQDKWDLSDKGRFYYNIQPKVNYATAQSLNVNRKNWVDLMRLKFGHSLLNGHANRIGITESPLCEFCSEDETVSHYFLECLRYQDLQLELSQYMFDSGIEVNMRNILTNHLVTHKTIDFINSTRRFVK
jgi:ribonuclease HI